MNYFYSITIRHLGEWVGTPIEVVLLKGLGLCRRWTIVDVLENKGIVFKARLVCTAWYQHGRDHYYALVIPRKYNGHGHVLSGRTNQASFKNNTFIIILKHFQK